MTATLTTGDALLRAVLDDPADGSVRLVYADWLEENGQGERAEFIRVQCALAGGKPCLADSASPRCSCRPECRRCALRRREREVALRCREWSGLPLLNMPWFVDYRGPTLSGLPPRALFRRGFVAEASCACADWLRHGPRLVRLQPLERVRLADREPTRYGNQGLMHPPGPRWLWFVAPSSGEMIYPPRHPAEIPRPIWTVYAELYRAEDLGWEHPTEEAAWDALSRACLAWARSQEPS
jgi:uncharacterized protein (TIGR02996 family)